MLASQSPPSGNAIAHLMSDISVTFISTHLGIGGCVNRPNLILKHWTRAREYPVIVRFDNNPCRVAGPASCVFARSPPRSVDVVRARIPHQSRSHSLERIHGIHSLGSSDFPRRAAAFSPDSPNEFTQSARRCDHLMKVSTSAPAPVR